MVGDAGGRVKSLAVSRQFIPAQKPEHRVFLSPYIPLFRLILRSIVPDVSVGGLRGDDVTDRFGDFAVKCGISGVAVCAYCSERPLSPEFAVPLPALDPVAERLHNLIDVLLHHAMPETVVNPPADISADLHGFHLHIHVIPRHSAVPGEAHSASENQRGKTHQ